MEKAIAIDEWSQDALTTSMVDDVFFVLQKCGGRALAIGSLQCLCAILGQLNNLLRDSLRSALEYKWKVSLCARYSYHHGTKGHRAALQQEEQGGAGKGPAH